MATSTPATAAHKAELAEELRHVMSNGAGYPCRGRATTDQLERAARELMVDPTLDGYAVVGQLIDDVLHSFGDGDYTTAMRDMFRLTEDSKPLSQLQDRRKLAAKTLHRSEGSMLDEADLLRMTGRIAEAIVNRLAERAAGEAWADVTGRTTDRRVQRWRWILVAAAVGALVAAALTSAALGVFSGTARRAHTSAPSIALLGREAGMPLGQANTPPPGSMSPTLGYGDSVGGRRTYAYADATIVPDKPLLDSLTDATSPGILIGDASGFFVPGSHIGLVDPLHAGYDQRRFVGVDVDQPYTGVGPAIFAPNSAVVAQPAAVVGVGIFVANSGPTSSCNPGGPDTARNVRVRVAIWDSPDMKLHIIRAWITADPPASPRWVTDAAAVITSKPASLVLDRRNSAQNLFTSSHFPTRPVSGQLFAPGGMLIAHQGRLATCLLNSDYLSLDFSQLPYPYYQRTKRS